MDFPNRNWNRFVVRMAVYGLAVVMDIVLSGLLFIIELRAAELNCNAMVAGSLFGTWSGVYLITSLVLGPRVKSGHAAGLMLATCVAMVGISIGFIVWPGLRAMYLWAGLHGAASVFFFVPFQMFMKVVDEGQNKGLAHSSGLYVFSWSLGYALGPFVLGFLWRYGWSACHVFNALAAFMTGVGVVSLRGLARRSTLQSGESGPEAAGEHGLGREPARAGRRMPGVTAGEVPFPRVDPEGPSAEGGLLPDLAWMGWVFSGLGCMVACLLRSQFPHAAHQYGVAESTQGTVFFVYSGTQAVVGLLLGWSKRWMYRPWPVLAFGVMGVLGMLLFAAGRRAPVFTMAAASFGIYTGSIYFYIVYHSLIHPIKAARYVSINEAVVGVAGMLGPALGGVLGDHVSLWSPYAAAAGLLLAGVVIQALLHGRQGEPWPAQGEAGLERARGGWPGGPDDWPSGSTHGHA